MTFIEFASFAKQEDMREQRLNGATVKFRIDDQETPPQVDSELRVPTKEF